jgi:hypothetical protein
MSIDKSIRMNLNEILELDYVVKDISDNRVKVQQDESNATVSYISKKSVVFDPNTTGTNQIDIDGQTIEIKVFDIPDNVVDYFEKPLYEDKGNQLSDYYEGDLSTASRQQTTILEGNSSLSVADGESGSFIGSTKGLPNYPKQDEKFKILVQNPSSGGRIYTYFFVQSANGEAGYRVGVRPELDDFILQEINSDGSTASVIDSTNVSLSTGVTYKVETLPESTGQITSTLFDEADTQIAQVSGSNSAYSTGGVGYRIEKADAVIDNFRIL